MIPLRIVKIQAILDFPDIDRIFVRRVLQNELFEVQERSLVWHLLAHLDDSSPCVRSV